jgi:hypothetical protein
MRYNFLKQQKINIRCISTTSIKIVIFYRQLRTISRKTDITTVVPTRQIRYHTDNKPGDLP